MPSGEAVKVKGRTITEIKKDIEYLRTCEDLITTFFVGNVGYSAMRNFLDGETKVTRELQDLTLNYLKKVSDLRSGYESELEEALQKGVR